MASNPHLFVSSELAQRRDVVRAATATLVSGVVFFAILPFAAMPLAHVPAFIPAYESALILSDLITAVLLFGQFKILQSRALFVLACGYLFTAIVAVAHELSFPGVFSATGLLGAGSQITVWLYVIWHGGFPACVLLYALLKNDSRERIAVSRIAPGRAILCAVSVVAGLALGLAFFTWACQAQLPVLFSSDRFTLAFRAVITAISILCLVSLFVIWRRRPLLVLDLWLMVVMCAWIFDLTLCGVFNAGRFDVGWYGGRIYGLLASSSLLIVLLNESAAHYARLAKLSAELGAANVVLEQLSLQDGLTGLANRRHFDAYLASQISVANRQKRALALVLCDVDQFKAYNDRHGHPAGDECLRLVASALLSCCRRPADMVARYGGEEFALILPDTDLIGAALIAEAARVAVAQMEISHACFPTSPYVTISGGVSVLIWTLGTTAEQLIADADATLYEAKKLGRNRMICVRPKVRDELAEAYAATTLQHRAGQASPTPN